MLDLGPRARRAFIVAFVAVELALVLTADWRPDRIFGFRMFNESSALKFDLYRRVQRGRSSRLLKVEDGAWQVKTPAGPLLIRWDERVRYSALRSPGVQRHASYGAEAQLFRLQAALEDAMAHLPAADQETQELIAEVEATRNGRAAEQLRLSAVRR